MDFHVFCLIICALLIIENLGMAWINRNKPACPSEKDDKKDGQL